MLDDDMAEFLKEIHKDGHLENAVLIMFSDHGARFSDTRDSEEGKIEERMPMFAFRFPDWFRQMHKQKIQNFKVNAKSRLTTPFDIHATFLHLLDLSKPKHEVLHFKPEKGVRAISLFQEVPASRRQVPRSGSPY
jgi:phosphoglycerol transferase MdoB-like AlkP superfamily enzyme